METFFYTFDELYQFWVDGWMWVFETSFIPFVVILELIPVPTFAQNMGSLNMPSGVAWFAQALELPSGAAIMVSAWGIRFVVRRLPFIG